MLFDKYVTSSAHRAKKLTTRRDDESRLGRVIRSLGGDRDAVSLSEKDVEEYTELRLQTGVGPRTIEADLVALRIMLNWATRQRNGVDRPLLQYNPLRGVKLPKEKNPLQPVETYDRYVKVVELARDVDWRLPAVLMLVESTGQRISSVLQLRRQDFEFERAPNGGCTSGVSTRKQGTNIGCHSPRNAQRC